MKPNKPEHIVTYREMKNPNPLKTPVTAEDFDVLDYVCIDRDWLKLIPKLRTWRGEDFASSHFLLTYSLNMILAIPPKPPPEPKYDHKLLQHDIQARTAMYQYIIKEVEGLDPSYTDPDTTWTLLKKAILEAQEIYIPPKDLIPLKPWISHFTLSLIEARATARQRENVAEWAILEKRIKKSVRSDKQCWIQDIINKGSWDELKIARRKFMQKPISLRQKDGQLGTLKDRVNILADQYEHVQWTDHVSDQTLQELAAKPKLLPPQHFEMGGFTYQELTRAIASLKNNKSPKPSNISNELWKLLSQDPDLLHILLLFFNKIF